MSKFADDHMRLLKLIEESFQICKIALQTEVKDISFDSGNFDFYFFRNDEKIAVMPNGMDSFILKRKTNLIEDEIVIKAATQDYSQKFRKYDLLYYVSEGFGIKKFIDRNTDMTDDQIKKFFSLSEKLLDYLGHNTEALLMDMNPRCLHASTCADTLEEFLFPLIVKLKGNEQAAKELAQIIEHCNRLEADDPDKLNYILDELGTLVNKHKIH
ncbi:hypothetical protein [Paenibacillus polymyxa]|jgi:hypothetical protein|uniref:hypothetical protein n=1 Tax=Paenibacillus polymyxa TaxID=1406 RepID=UPI00083D6A93|nr:hypothetical protein [Paenibacillus polymyxa]ODB61347.1 hypothetical protein A7309_14970 [Paenibacillus polymyxa]